jgi:hypothetical protein
VTESKKGMTGPDFNKEHTPFYFGAKGLVHCEFVPPNTTVNSDFYRDILRHLKEMCNEKDQNFGATTTGSFITTTHPPTRP